jgi:fatty-acyl-CoA synthase
VAFVVAAPGAELTDEALTAFLTERVAKWWLPDLYVFLDELPKTSTGKFDKKVLRKENADLLV